VIAWVGEFLRSEKHLADSSLAALVEAWPLALGPPSPDSPRHPIATSSISHPTLYHDLTQYNLSRPIGISGEQHSDIGSATIAIRSELH
jgi:hypothetical protein